MPTRLTKIALAGCLLLTPTATAQKLDNYGDPLPPGAVLRLGTTRLQSFGAGRKGGFAWTPDGKSLVTMKHGTVYFWDMADGHCRETLLVPIDANCSSGLALSRDGKRLVCTDRFGAIASWDLEKSVQSERKGDEPGIGPVISASVLSPDGATLATTGGVPWLALLQFWDAATCQLKRSFKLAEKSDGNLAFSPAGNVLAVSCGESILLYDVAAGGEPLAIPLPPRSGAYSVTFAPDGQRLFASVSVAVDDPPKAAPAWRTELAVFDVVKRVEAARWRIDPSIPAGCSIAVSPDGKSLVTVHTDRILVWNLATQSVVRTIEGLYFTNAAWAQVTIDPTGQYVAVDENGNYVRLWNLTTGQPHLSTDYGHRDSVSNAAWSADGSTIATGASGTDEVRLWSATTGKVVGRLDRELSFICGLVYAKRSADIIVFGSDASLNLRERPAVLHWHDAATGKLSREHRLGGKAWRFAPSPDESRMAVETYESDAAGAKKAALQIIEAQTGNVVSSVAVAPESTETLAWAPDGKSIYQVTSKGLTRLEVGTGRLLLDKALPHFRRNATTGVLGRGSIWHAAFFEDAHEVLTTGSLPEIFAWSTIAGELRWTLPTGKLFIRGLALSPDESLVACIEAVGDSDTKTLRLFQIGSKRELAHFDLGRENCDRIVFSPDGGRILVGFYDGTALVYDVSAALNKVE